MNRRPGSLIASHPPSAPWPGQVKLGLQSWLRFTDACSVHTIAVVRASLAVISSRWYSSWSAGLHVRGWLDWEVHGEYEASLSTDRFVCRWVIGCGRRVRTVVDVRRPLRCESRAALKLFVIDRLIRFCGVTK
jgi:hypothetical protein